MEFGPSQVTEPASVAEELESKDLDWRFKVLQHRKRMTDLDNMETGFLSLLHCRTPELVLFSRGTCDGKALNMAVLHMNSTDRYLD